MFFRRKYFLHTFEIGEGLFVFGFFYAASEIFYTNRFIVNNTGIFKRIPLPNVWANIMRFRGIVNLK